MKLTYDPEVDAAYIYFKKGKGQVTTVRISDDVSIDLGPNEELWGIEVLGAGNKLGVTVKGRKPKVELENFDVVEKIALKNG
jgi:uncharacterized protein YuzE